jgi:glycosyltransferase involved in cell wall biosynthesis
MNIAVDAFPLASATPSGIPNYVRSALKGLLDVDRENRYYLYCRNPFEFPERENLTFRISRRATETSPSYGNTLWLFTEGVRMMGRDGIDILWGTRHMLPPLLPGKIRKVLTVHDLVWRYYPETMERYNRLVMSLLAGRSIKEADHIIAVSHATARSIREVFGIAEKKITVVHHAAGGYEALGREESAAYISEKYGTGDNYVLTVSTVEPRKNLSTLLRAFSRLKGEGFQLVVAGAPGWKTSAIREEYERLGLTEGEVKFLGYVPDGDMNRLYSGAGLFVFPSLYEGFGLPPLEAMASGAPVLASNSSSIPEVVGDAGMLLEPLDEEGWAGAIARVMSEPSTRAEMSGNSLKRAGAFSWEKAARETLGVFEKVLARPGR